MASATAGPVPLDTASAAPARSAAPEKIISLLVTTSWGWRRKRAECAAGLERLPKGKAVDKMGLAWL